MCENKLTISGETEVRENDYRKMAAHLQEHCCVCRQVELPDKTSYREILRNIPVLEMCIRDRSMSYGSNMRGSETYRRHLAEVCVRRALEKAAEQ